MDSNKLSDTLLTQRKGLALSVEALAASASLSAGRLTELEAGASATTSEVVRLARALAVDAAALWRGDVPASRTTARFRAPTGVLSLASEDALLLSRAAEVGRVGGHLASLLGRADSPVVVARQVLAVESWPEPWEQGYKLGAGARARLAPERAPIGSIAALFESLLVHVATVDLVTDDLHAVSLYEAGALPIILLNASAKQCKSPLSRRAILAHELCHLLHDGGSTDLLTLISRGADTTPHEQRANGFAPSFIVPGGWLAPHTTDARELVTEIAATWGLSLEGAAWHAKNAGHITNAVAEALVKDLAKQSVAFPDGGFEKPPPASRAHADLPPPHPVVRGLVSRLVAEAVDADALSVPRAREILLLR